MSARVQSMIEAVAREYQEELAAAGTLVELEELTCRVGDEVARQLCERELVDRGRRAAEAGHCECPECGAMCFQGEAEAVVLQGLRGEVGYRQPSYYCRCCRRSFFPAGGVFGAVGAEHGHAEDLAEDGVGGR